MKKPQNCTLEELAPYAREYASRVRLGKPTRPKSLRPCPKCGAEMGARELRVHVPSCGKTADGETNKA